VRSTGHDDALAKLDALGGGNAHVRGRRAELREVLVRSEGLGRGRGELRAEPVDRARSGLLHRRRLRDHAERHPQIGSICSGGRYENLASHYTKSKLPGVGISIGLTRLFFQLREAGLVDTASSSVDVLVALMDDGLSAEMRSACRSAARGRFERRNAAGTAQAGEAVAVRDKAGIRFVVMHAAKTRPRAAWSR
jgi:histidyl-tRNA synthetase